MRRGPRVEPRNRRCPEVSLPEQVCTDPRRVANAVMRAGVIGVVGETPEAHHMDRGKELIEVLELADEFTAAIGPPSSLKPLPIFRDMIAESEAGLARDTDYGEA